MNAIDVLDETVLREVQSINLRGLQLLQNPWDTADCQPVAGPLPGDNPAVGAAGSPREIALWRSIDPAALQRLADQPFLLFDIGLDDPLRWHAALTPSVGDEPVLAAAPFGARASAQFAGMMFHYSWYLARTAPLTAAVVAGMAPATAAALRSLRLQQIDELAQRNAHWLRLRWEDSPVLWTQLLRAARSAADAPQLWAARLRVLQRLAGAALSRRTPAPPFSSGQHPGSL